MNVRNVTSGDIIGVVGKGFVSGAINVGTFAPPYPLPGAGISHTGIICHVNGTPVVFESTTLGRPECIIQDRQVNGVQAHTLDDYLTYGHGQVWRYPIRAPLYDDEYNRLSHLVQRSLGLPYDMAGALRSGGLLFRTVQMFMRNESTDSLFCSEWCADLLVEIGRFHTRHKSSWNPNRLCRALVREGIHDKPERLV